MNARATIIFLSVALGACSSSKSGSDMGATADLARQGPPDLAPSPCSGATKSTAAAATLPKTPALTVPAGLVLEAIASVGQARELVALPNGDLLVATLGNDVYLVPSGEDMPGTPTLFTSINDSPVNGLAFDNASCTLFVAAQHGIYSFPYVDAQASATAGMPIATIRNGTPTPGSDGDVHTTTSLAVSGGKLYAGVGSGCNACVEMDPTRATIQVMSLDGSGMTTRATRMRNAIALATNPATGSVWAGGAGQDNLPPGHPYEYFDDVTAHAGVADYGWPACEENQHAYFAGSDCSKTVMPIVETTAYSSLIGAAFYPASPTGAHALPAQYHGGAILAAHGSWHMTNNVYYTAPRIYFVAMSGDTPAKPVNWADPSVQWTELVGGFQLADGVTRIARPTGVAVGPQGTLFFADDQNGLVYRLRPQ